MRKESPSPSTPPVAPKRPGPPSSAQLAQLAARFERFRRESGRGARVPAALRSAVLAALEDGVAPGDVYRACGVSWGQVAAWKAGTIPPAARPAELPPVRAFEVVDERPRDAAPPLSGLEFRFGPWFVSVRLADDGAAGGR